MSKQLYRVVDFDKKVFSTKLVAVFITAGVVTIVNQLLSLKQFPWMKAAENALLFYVTTILTGLYFGILIAVFLTGSQAWEKVVTAARKTGTKAAQEKRVSEALKVSADPFLAYGLRSVWVGMALTGLFLYFPVEVCWLLTLVLTITGMLTVFAFDYWGFENGIKRIEKVEK